jgi:hypothetical protein
MPKFNDLTGKTIGRLTFLEEKVVGLKRFWKVKCQCSEIQTYRADYFTVMQKQGVKFECKKCKMERKSPTLTDKVFGRLTVLREAPAKDKHRWWLCRCECGVEKSIPGIRLISSGKTKLTRSCGCLARKLHSKWVNTTQYPPAHSFRSKNSDPIKKRIYHCRRAMVSSCYNTKDPRFKHHGAMGHKICDLWRNGAKDFVNWALENKYQQGDGIFLRDDSNIFSPDSCFIMSKKEFSKRKNSKLIDWKGKVQSISDWAKDLGCSQSCLSERLKKYSNYGLDKIMDLSWVKTRVDIIK